GDEPGDRGRCGDGQPYRPAAVDRQERRRIGPDAHEAALGDRHVAGVALDQVDALGDDHEHHREHREVHEVVHRHQQGEGDRGDDRRRKEHVAHHQRVLLRISPSGRTRSTPIISRNEITSLYPEDTKADEKDSVTPSTIPPMMAPGMEPSPPRMRTAKPLMTSPPLTPGATAYSAPTSTPAATPSAEERANTNIDTRFTSTPMRTAVARFWATARIAMPIHVRCTIQGMPTTRSAAMASTYTRSSGKVTPPM